MRTLISLVETKINNIKTKIMNLQILILKVCFWIFYVFNLNNTHVNK